MKHAGGVLAPALLSLILTRGALCVFERRRLLWCSGAQPSSVNNASSLALQYHSAR